MKTDQYFRERGYERVSLDSVSDIDAPTHHGIDGVYYNPDGEPPYIIAEAKFGSSRLRNTLDGRQMSDTWIMGSNRLENAVGKELADDILMEGYGRELVGIGQDGSVSVSPLDELGREIKVR